MQKKLPFTIISFIITFSAVFIVSFRVTIKVSADIFYGKVEFTLFTFFFYLFG